MANETTPESPQQARERVPAVSALVPHVLSADRGAPSAGRARARVAGVAVAIALLVAAIALAAAALRPRASHEPAELDTAHYLRPIETTADPLTGEETAPFAGFAVSVETEPPGALVTIAGVERGEAPVLAGVECRPGARVQIRAVKEGFRPARATTTCRADALVKLTVRLVE